jgi:hypothetical protein
MYTQQILLGVAIPPPSGLITVTGGTLTTDGDFSIRSFTANGTLGISGGNLSVEYLVVAGGGGGGNSGTSRGAGGGGAGGLLTGNTTLNANSYSITVGNGGAAATNGANSVLHTFTAVGGGAGGGGNGSSGGSGGGGSGDGVGAGGAGTAGQGNNGGNGGTGFGDLPGGGGGAGGAGISGGAGSTLTLNITGANVDYAGGGYNTTPDGPGSGGRRGNESNGFAGRDGIVIVRYLTAGTN